MSVNTPKILSLLICSAQEDRDLCQELDKHLGLLRMQGWITCWSDQQILAGMEREREMTWHRQNADIFLLLISPDFLASEDCQQTMHDALQRAAKGAVVVIPVLLRPVAWEKAEFRALQVLPTNHLPVTSWTNHDEAFEQITERICTTVEMLRRWVIVVSLSSHQPVSARLGRDLETYRVPVRKLDLSLDQADIQEAIRLSSAVLLLTSAETCSSSSVRQTVEWAAIYQREVLLLWLAGEDQNELIPRQWRGIRCIDGHSERYDIALQEVLVHLKGRLSVLPPDAKADRDHQPRNPYKGLRAFGSMDVRDFFGREALIEVLITTLKQTLQADKLGQQQGRLLAVIGASGSGKSSVVMAGLLPRLRAGTLPGSSKWIFLGSITPGEDPIESLTIVLSEHFPQKRLRMIREDLEEDSACGLHQYATLIARRQEMLPTHVVLIVDQFEELFSQTMQEGKCRHFLDLLIMAMTISSGPLIVILTLRADFYDHVMHYPDLYHLIDTHHCAVLPMDIRELRQVIERPAALSDAQLQFEGELVSNLLFEVRGEVGALPLLQFTLDQLFHKRKGHLLTQRAYQEIGGVKGALSQHAEQTYVDLPTEEHRKLVRGMVLRLIAPGVAERDATRRRARYSEFTVGDSAQTRLLQETIEIFIARRLLTASEVAGMPMIEVGHEALLWEWPRLVGWIREARDDMHLQQTLSKAAAKWEQRKRSADRLYRGTQLKEARSWSKRNTPSANEQIFLRASATRQVQSVVSFVIIVLLLILSASVTGWYALHQAPDPTRVTNRNDDGQGSLRWCIASARDGSTITFDQSVRGTIHLTNGDLIINKKLIIRGPGANILAISSGHTNFKIHIFPKVSVTISALSFKDSRFAIESILSNLGSIIYNEGILHLTNTILSGNASGGVKTSYGFTSFDGRGGGIYNQGTIFLTNSILSGNFAGNGGGGIYNQGTIFLANSTLSGNSTRGSGGAILNDQGMISLINSILSGNSADKGGGIANEGGTVFLTNLTLSDNSANFDSDSDSPFSTGDGGGILNDGTISLADTILFGNSASTDGGGILNDGTISLTNAILSGNSASGNHTNFKDGGGGIYNIGMISLINSTLSGNSAKVDGGGIFNNYSFNDHEGMVSLTNSTLFSNSASNGGGISNEGGAIELTFCTVAGNNAFQGGGIFLEDYKDDYTGNNIYRSKATMRNSILVANHADTDPDISGPLISGGYNLIQNTVSAVFTPKKEDRFMYDISHVFEQDMQLQNHSGPTQTLALLPDPQNPALGAIPRSSCQIKEIFDNHLHRYIDQRGMKRPGRKKTACDIGAYEYQE